LAAVCHSAAVVVVVAAAASVVALTDRAEPAAVPKQTDRQSMMRSLDKYGTPTDCLMHIAQKYGKSSLKITIPSCFYKQPGC